MKDVALALENVTKRYVGFSLEEVTFQLPRGYVMGLIGANGAGKTTILKLIMNLVRRDAGRITVFGKDNLEHEADIKRNIGFVYDVPRFYDDARLSDLALAIAPFYPGWDQTRFDALTSEFGLPMRHKFKKLSTGMKTRFAVSVALSHDADLILMDEPMAGLGTEGTRELTGLLDALRSEAPILLVEHDMDVVFSLADRITVLNYGRVIASGSTAEIRSDPDVRRAYLGEEP